MICANVAMHQPIIVAHTSWTMLPYGCAAKVTHFDHIVFFTSHVGELLQFFVNQLCLLWFLWIWLRLQLVLELVIAASPLKKVPHNILQVSHLKG